MKKILVSLFALGGVSIEIIPIAEAYSSCATSWYGSGPYRTRSTYLRWNLRCF